LLDTTAREDTAEASAARRTQMQLTESGQFAQVVEALIPRLVHPARLGEEALIGPIRAMGHAVGAAGYLNQQRAIIGRPDSRPLRATIPCPTLVVVGDADLLTPPERAQEMAEGIRGARLVVVPDCGHLSTLERPAAVTGALRAWLGH